MWSPRRCFENTILISNGGDVNLVEFIELEPSGIEGKDIRAELTKMTGGTDIHVVCVCERGAGWGLYGWRAVRDGCLRALHESGKLTEMLKLATR
jgi:hypothetical protein